MKKQRVSSTRKSVKLADDRIPKGNSSIEPREVTINVQPLGSSGIEIYAGYYQEEYLSSLNGTQRADFYDKMKRSDPKAKMLLSAAKNPIKAANWVVDPGDESDDQIKIAELISHILFDDMTKTWTETLTEILTMYEHGYSLFEPIDKIVIGHKKFGNYNGLKLLAFRSQRTIERWNLDHVTGELLSVDQYAYGDLSRLVTIPVEQLLLFSLEQEGDNYEGISWLRPCVGAYKRKDHHLKQEAIGMSKYAIPTPVLTIPKGKENSPEYATAVAILKKYATHEQQFITIPVGWEMTFMQNEFHPDRIRASINAENVEMVHAFLANFLELGNTGTGSYSLSFDLSDFFLGAIEHVAKQIAEKFNRFVIPRLVNLNFGPQEVYPKLRCSGITDKAGKEFAEVVKMMVDGKVIIPDDKLEEDIRKRYNLPEKSEDGQRELQNDPAKPNDANKDQKAGQGANKKDENIPGNVEDDANDNNQLSEKTHALKLSEPKSQIKADREVLIEFMQGKLNEISDNMIQKIMARYRGLGAKQKLSAIKDLPISGQSDYQKETLELLASFANKAIEQARKEVPKKKNVRLTESVPRGTLALAEFEKLPLDIQKRLRAQSQLLIGSQITDLQKGIFFRYQSSAESTDSESLVESDLKEVGVKFVLSGAVETGASNIVASVVNDARNAFFLDDEVSEDIESFTFVNGDPISPICQDLAGTVFAKDDPNIDRYWPPLHHNCKSYIVPNLKGKKNPDITEGGFKPSKSSLDKFVTLSETSDGLGIHQVFVSKKYCQSMADAMRIAGEYRISLDRASETEEAYKFVNKDAALFEDGTLKSFEPMEGVTIFVGMPKPLMVQNP